MLLGIPIAKAAGHRSASGHRPRGHRVARDAGRGPMASWLNLVDEHGFLGRYASVRRFVPGQGGAHRLRREADGARAGERLKHDRLRHDAPDLLARLEDVLCDARLPTNSQCPPGIRR